MNIKHQRRILRPASKARRLLLSAILVAIGNSLSQAAVAAESKMCIQY